jgi:hypothetical protein
MPTFNPQEINNGKELTAEQIERIDYTIRALAAQSTKQDARPNAMVITLAHNLKMSGTVEEKRKWIVMFYINCFQLLSFINMARDKEMELEAYKQSVNDFFALAGKNGHNKLQNNTGKE